MMLVVSHLWWDGVDELFMIELGDDLCCLSSHANARWNFLLYKLMNFFGEKRKNAINIIWIIIELRVLLEGECIRELN